MKRFSAGVTIVGCVTLLSCDNAVEPPTTGGIDLRILTLVDSPAAAAETEAAAVGQAAEATLALDSGRVIVTGPTSKTVSATPGQTVVIDALLPGSYTVRLEGWEGDEITHTGTTTGIQVTAGENSPADVLFGPASLSFNALGDMSQLNVNAGGVTVSWVSSDPSVATVDASGLVTAVSNGQGTITATSRTSSVDITVTVAQEVTEVTVAPASASLDAVGQTVTFTAEARDANNNVVTGAATVWLSSNHNIATISSGGVASATGSGTVTITGAVRGVPGTATLAVNQAPARLAFRTPPGNAVAGDAMSAFEVEVQDANRTLVGNATSSVTLQIGVNPGSGSLGGTTTVAAVNGVARFDAVTIDNVGNGYSIQATSTNLTTVTSAVFDIVHPTIVVTPGGLDLLIGAGDIVQYQAIGVNPFTGAVSSPGVTWSVDDQAVATIDLDRGVLEVVANGTASVTATTSSGASGSTAFTSATVTLTKLLEFAYNILSTPMGLTWDGTNYYLSNGGSAASGTIQQLDATGTVTQTTPVNLDMRGVFYRQADAIFYMKSFGLDWYTVDPNTGVFTQILTGIFSQNQSRPDLSNDETLIYEHINGTIRVLDFTTGAELSTFSRLQNPNTFPHDHVVAAPEGKLITMDATGLAYMYDLQGRLVTTFMFPNTVLNQSAWTLSYTNDLLFISDTGSGVGNFFGYRVDKQ